MKDNGFNIEELDDERTLTGELVQDCDRNTPFSDEVIPLPVLEYLGEFKALIDACGEVSYFFNMKKFVTAGVNKAKIVAAAYQHDLRYYENQLNEWRAKAERSYAVLGFYAPQFGYEMPERKVFLNMLALSIERRKAYKDYLRTCLKHMATLSPVEMEKKYQKRLEKRISKING